MPIYLVDNNGAPINIQSPNPNLPTPLNITLVDHYLPYDTHNTYEITIDSSHTIQTLLTSSPSQVDSWLLQTQSQSPLLVGLDIEWRPNSQRGQSNPAATLQLCTNNRCLVFQIIHSPSIPTSLLTFLANPNNRFVGVGIEADVEKLIEDYDMSVRNFVDLRNLAAEVLDDRDLLRSGIKSLGERVLGKIIEKPQRITRSRWDNPWLNADQVKYATVDAYVSFEIGRRLYSNQSSTAKSSFAKGPSMYMVTDDLFVSPMSSISTVSFLKRSKVTLSDLEERVIKIGVKEGLGILKASLISTSALTIGLNQFIKTDKDIQASTSAFSAPQDVVKPESNTEALGIDNGKSWSVQLPDGSSATQVVEVTRSPMVEELPLPPNIQPEKPSTSVVKKGTKNKVPVSALRRSSRKRKCTNG